MTCCITTAPQFRAGHAGRPASGPALPCLEATNPEPTAGQRVWWMATRGNRWLLRRSTDLLPAPARMVVDEMRRRPAEFTAPEVRNLR
jgi:hypothetical protein